MNPLTIIDLTTRVAKRLASVIGERIPNDRSALDAAGITVALAEAAIAEIGSPAPPMGFVERIEVIRLAQHDLRGVSEAEYPHGAVAVKWVQDGRQYGFVAAADENGGCRWPAKAPRP